MGPMRTTLLRRLLYMLVAIGCVTPKHSMAQPINLNDRKGTVEVGFFQEWFHRSLEPSIYDDTRWNISSISFQYDATDWLNLGFEGGRSRYESEDFDNSEFDRYSVGFSAGARVYRWSTWQLSAGARYQDTFDLDTSPHFFHKRVRSVSGSVNVVGQFAVFRQAVTLSAGPIIVDDLVQSFPLDSLDPIESTSGTAPGANVGARVVFGGWISVYGFASYVEEIQGGVGLCLHAGKGSL